MERLTSARCNGIKSGYWSAAKKEDLIQRLGRYEDTGLQPEEIKAASKWISVEEKLPPLFKNVITCRKCNGEMVVENGIRRENGVYKIAGSRIIKIIAWMPLPDAPKEEL